MEYHLELHLKWGPKSGCSSIADLYGVDEIIRNYGHVIREVEDNTYELLLDWTQLRTLVKTTLSSNSKFYRTVDGESYKLASKAEQLVVPMIVVKEGDLSLNSTLPDIEKLLTEIYIVSNISIPGILDLYQPKIYVNGECVYELVALSSYYFEELDDGIRSKKYPFARKVKFSQVKNWYKSLRIGESSFANSPAENAIYSLLHITTIEQQVIGVVPWIFCALESIFPTNVGRGGAQLKEQALFLLNPKAEHKKRFMQKLERLASLRHSFIHGAYKVPFLHHDDFNHEEFDLVEFGVVLVILSIQRLAENNWSGLTIESVISPNKISSE
ncbi:hypothetical protein [Pseudoalteromonas sp.]|uniref:hypothetical protein n=1 Tax=Pseudoalteromonas sp. TaxID=53249 RepID=UPI00261449CF|nr:hypothetical protein [Pseudoalteromonas sp.]MCP3865558.1 hypothetical protein [Aestuariibacter sp.]MCP4588924.1 hypothetical protein [Pseudoalteromonas sp.]